MRKPFQHKTKFVGHLSKMFILYGDTFKTLRFFFLVFPSIKNEILRKYRIYIRDETAPVEQGKCTEVFKCE